MSDEYQPNEVVESQPEVHAMVAEPSPKSLPKADVPTGDATSAEASAEPEAPEAVDDVVAEVEAEPAPPEEASVAPEAVDVADTAVPEAVEAVETAVDDAAADVETEPAAPEEVPVAPEEVATTGEETPVAEMDEAMTASSDAAEGGAVVSISDLETSQTSMADKIDVVLLQAGMFLQEHTRLVGIAIVVLLLVGALALLVPNISLAQLGGSVGGNAYTTLDADNPTTEHPDGLTVRLNDGEEAKLRVKLSSIPRAEFVAASLPEELRPALDSLPEQLVPKSPYYAVDLRGKQTGPATLEVVIPNEAEPWETLDLYTWDGASWRWLPSRLDRGAEVLVTDLDVLPDALMVMQTQALSPRVATVSEALPEPGFDTVLTEVDIPGMLIGTIGGLTGDPGLLPVVDSVGGMTVVPVVRNWVDGREPNWALVSDMLNQPTDQDAHVRNLLELVQRRGYAGLVVDYRAVRPEARESYAEFIGKLAQALHEEGLWLAVNVDAPMPTASGWDTGGYDWAAIGAAADQLRFPMPLSPQAYVPGGTAEQLLTWAAERVNRYRLVPKYSTLSTDGEETLPLASVLGTLGDVRPTAPLTNSVEPGAALSFTLGEGVTVHADATTGAVQVDARGEPVWLGTPQWLRTRMDLVARYHLGGVVLRDVLDPGNVPDLIPALADYLAGGEGGAYTLPEVVWQVTGPGGSTIESKTALTQPQFGWTAPAMTGTYEIAVDVAGLDKGAVNVVVDVPAPVVTDTLASDAAMADLGGGETTEAPETADTPETAEAPETVDTALTAAFVADVSVPDNTRFEKGEAFVKTWRLRNASDVAWPEDTVFVFAEGEQLAEETQVAVGEVPPGETVEISVDMAAPEADGSYKSYWQLQADGERIEGGKVYVLIQVGEPAAAPAPAAPGPVAPAPASSGFELGGHVRDTNLPYADKMHYAGMNWTKVQVHFGQDASGLIHVAHANGFKIQLSALGGPDMVTKEGFEQEFAGWVAQLAAQGADAIEVWNEPNIEREWKIGHISPQAYTNLLCASYNAIKNANSGTAVISAAPAPTGWFGGCGPNGCDDQPWLQGLYNAGAANCMDYIGAHHNAGATSPSARSGHPADPGSTHHSWFFLPQTELYYNIFHGTRQLFYTEMGYASQEGLPTFSDQFAWARGTNNSQQAAWLAEAVQLGINTGMVRCIIVWNIDFVRYGYDPQDGFAIIRPGGGCPACDALHNVLGTR